MPPQWQDGDVGVYGLTVVSRTKVLLKHRILQKEVLLPERFVSRVSNPKHLIVDANWSERHAQVKDSEGVASLTCSRQFVDLTEDTAFSVVRPSDAIEDGHAEEGDMSDDDEQEDSAPPLVSTPLSKKQPHSSGGSPASGSSAQRPSGQRLPNLKAIKYDESAVVPPPPPQRSSGSADALKKRRNQKTSA